MRNGLYKLYRHHYDAVGVPSARDLLGRLLLTDKGLRILEDHHGTLKDSLPPGEITPDHERMFQRFMESPDFRLLNEADIAAGEHPMEIPELDLGLGVPEASFFLTGGSLSKPIRMDVHGDTLILDGVPVGPDQSKLIESQVQQGLFQLVPVEEALGKSENGDAYAATHNQLVQHLDDLKARQRLTPEEHEALVSPLKEQYKRYFSDCRIPMLGNREAFDLFKRAHHDVGTHVSIDATDFGLVNKHLGFEEGDRALEHMGRVFHEHAIQHMNSKGFRKGGDEFHFWFQDPEQAATFVRGVRSHLEGLPRIGGIFNRAIAVGIALSYDAAEQALTKSKQLLGAPDKYGKRKNAHFFGNAPTTVHNAITGESYVTPEAIATANAPTEEYIKTKSPLFRSRATGVVGKMKQFLHGLTKSTEPPMMGNMEPAVQPVTVSLPPLPVPTAQPLPNNAPVDHPAVAGGHVGILTAEAPKAHVHTPGGNDALERELILRGYPYEKVRGKYDKPENSFIVHSPDLDVLLDMGRRYGQESVIHSKDGDTRLIYTSDVNPEVPMVGKYHPLKAGEEPIRFYPPGPPPENYYTTLPESHGGHHFCYNIDFDSLLDLATPPKLEAGDADPAPAIGVKEQRASGQA